jgi:hypothetical protein
MFMSSLIVPEQNFQKFREFTHRDRNRDAMLSQAWGRAQVAAISSQTEKIELEEGAQTDRRRESIRMFVFFAKIYFGNPAKAVSVFYHLIVQHLWFPGISLLNQKKSLI